MMNNHHWDKCTDIIRRLSSRVERNQSAMVDHCEPTVPLCIEKSFYQYKSDVGQGCCVEACDAKLNEQFFNLSSSYRHQFTSSKMFDNKSEYIDYIVTNVLRQVVNHIPFSSLYQLSCCLPQNIENILCHTDMDSDRLIRILVADVLQGCDTNARQVTDWYAFANLITPLVPSVKAEDANLEKTNDGRTNVPSKQAKSSERGLSNHTKTSMVKSKQSTGTHVLSANRNPSTSVTPQIISTTDTVTPASVHSKEEFTPVGASYHSKTKSIQNPLSNKSSTTNPAQFLPFHERSTTVPTQDHRSSKNSDRSSSSDCVLTIHHKYKHKRARNHRGASSFDKALTRSVAIVESVQEDKHTLLDTPSIITDERPAHKTSRRSSTNTKESKTSDLFKLLSSSDNASKHLDPIESPSFHETLGDTESLSSDNEEHISYLVNEVAVHDDSLTDDDQLTSLQNSEKDIAAPTKTRINHYPNMLADFD